VVRTAVLGGLAGDIANASIRGVGLGDRVLTMLAIVPQWIRLLLFPWHLQADYMPRELDLATTFGLPQLIGSLLLGGLVALAVWSRRRAPVVCFGLCWTGIALFPVSNLAVPTGILLAERALFLASVGSALALGGGAAAAIPKFVAAPVGERRVVLAALGVLLGLGLWRSSTRQLVWRDNDTLFRQTVLDAPLSYKAHWAYGSMLIALGDMKQAELEYRIALRLYDGDPNLFSDFGDLYLRGRHCEPAIPLYQKSLILAPEQWKVRSKLVLCYLDLGKVADARSEAAQKTLRRDPDAVRIQSVIDSLTAAFVQFPPPQTGPKN
jgi:tetratricopeptide (TPR) repeat protein